MFYLDVFLKTEDCEGCRGNLICGVILYLHKYSNFCADPYCVWAWTLQD